MGVLQHLSSGKNIVLAASSVAGRDPNSLIPLAHSAASKQHAALFWMGQHWVIRDLGSANGTHLDHEKLSIGLDHPLQLGNVLRFGSGEEQWKLVDGRGPVAMAKCLETGNERLEESGVLTLPDDENVLVTITKDENGQFFLDTGTGDENRRIVSTGERLSIARQEWQLTLPPATPIAGTFKQPLQLTLAAIQVHLHVSLDQEHVRVEVVGAGSRIDLGRRSCFLALHVLAKQRLQDKAEGKLMDEECGWMEVEDLRLETGESERALNVSINRIREEFKDAGIEDGRAIIDSTSRRGKRRLTIDRITIDPG